MSKKALYLGIFIVATSYLIYSFLTYKNYGITSDEEVEYKSGALLLQTYITNKTSSINLASRHLPENTMYFRGHLAISNLLNPNFYYEQFHLINMIYALPIFLVIYILLFFEYKNFYLALLGPMFLFLTPRFFGHIPSNPKDIPFAVTFFLSIVSIYFIGKSNKSKYLKYLVLSLLFGLSQSFRSIGFTLHIILALFLLITGPVNIRNYKKLIFNSLLILIGSILVMILLMPILQKDFINGSKEILINSQSFSFWNNKILYFGEFLSKEQRPVGYLPVWILISTPLFILIPFIFSPIIFLIKKQNKNLLYLLFISILVNLLLYFIFKPVIYNGLRHFIYLLPIIVLISLTMIIEVFKILRKHFKYLIYPYLAILTILVLITLKDKIKLYPYEYIYFNEIIGGLSGAKGQFDTEYWGASYMENSIWVRDNLTSKGLIKVYSCDVAFVVDYYSHKDFETVMEPDEADYVICDYDNTLLGSYDLDIVNTVERLGVPLNYVMKVGKID